MNVKTLSAAMMIVLLAVKSWAQPYPVGVRMQAMGGSGAAEPRDAEAIYSNAALLSELRGASMTLFYTRPFGLREVNLASLAASARVAGFGLGVAMIDFGDEVYHDQYYHAAAARRFGEKSAFALGLSVQLRHLSIRGYGSATALGINLGTAFQFNSKIRGGVFITNVNQPELGEAREKISPTVCAGMAFSPREGWTLQLDYYREIGFDDEIRFGAETRVLPMLLLRVGGASNPDRFSAGLAIELGHAALQAAANTHSDLGTTQFYAISLSSKKFQAEGRQ